MSLVRTKKPSRYYDPFDSFFNSFFEGEFSPVSKSEGSFTPKVNVAEKDGLVSMEMPLPGFSKENIRIEVKDDLITISGEKKSEEREYLKKEFSYTKFKRAFTLNEEFDTDEIKAEFENGVLKIEMSRKQKETPSTKLIEVK